MPLLLILLKVTLLLAIALGLTLSMQRASAGSRHLVWLVALAGLFALPVLAIWTPLHFRVLPASLNAPAITTSRERESTASAPTLSGSNGAAETRFVIPPQVGSGATATAPSSKVATWVGSHAGEALLLLWLAIAATLAAWLAYGAWSVHRIVRRAAPLNAPDWQRPLYEIADRLDLAAAPRLVRSTDVRMPFACGLIHCTIVLPAECDDWSADRRTAVLIHELGHVRRYDLVGHTLSRLACAVYWFHPMVWSAARRLRAESERACDDLALRFGARPSDYAEHLLDIVTCVRNHATPSVALALAHRKEFEGRMLAILDPQLRRNAAGRIQSITIAAVLALVTIVISAAAPPHVLPAERQLALQPAGTAGTSAASSTDSGTREDRLPINGRGSTRTDVRTKLHTQVHTDLALSIALGAHHVLESMHSGDTTARVALLLQLLRSDSSADIRRIAAWGLSQYSGPSTKKALIAALAGDSDSQVREMAAWALVEGGEPDVASLTTAAGGDRAADVRETATWGLGSSADPNSAATLAQILTRDSSAEVRAAAAWALGQLDLSTAPKQLLNALTDPSRDVRMKAAWATSEIGDSVALPQIRLALRQEKFSEVQKAQLRALIRSGEDPEKMVEWLKSSDPTLREAAARALAGSSATQPWPWPWPRPRPQP
jgi:beta-lactamase regulating signal transducer with metallopeptidase domain